MSRLAFIFIVSALLIVTQQVLSIEDLTTTSWKFYNDAGYLGTLNFNVNGRITGYNRYNEVSWKINSNRMLEVYNGDGNLTVRYVWGFKDNYGKWRLQGKYLVDGNPTSNGWTHYLEQQIWSNHQIDLKEFVAFFEILYLFQTKYSLFFTINAL